MAFRFSLLALLYVIMNNVMDETAQEIADLKADLADAQKETARLERELQEAYSDKPAKVAPEEVKALTELQLHVEDARSKARAAQDHSHELEKRATEQQAKYQALHADLVMALSLLEVVRLNKAESWTYFMSTDQGRKRMKWAQGAYKREMDVFLNQLPKEK